MALKNYMGVVLVVSVLGFAGCVKPVKNDPGSTTTPSVPVVVETSTPEPIAVATTPATNPTASGSPAVVASATPGGATAAAGGANAEMLTDYEDAEGMDGYDEVLALTPPASSPALVAKGKDLFAQNCATCHGDAGLGDGAGGASLDPKPRNLTDVAEYKYGHLELALHRTAAFGIPDTGMAPWGDIISADDQWAIGAYIRTLQK